MNTLNKYHYNSRSSIELLKILWTIVNMSLETWSHQLREAKSCFQYSLQSVTVGSTMTSRLAILAKVRRMRSALSFTLSFTTTALEIVKLPALFYCPLGWGCLLNQRDTKLGWSSIWNTIPFDNSDWVAISQTSPNSQPWQEGLGSCQCQLF